MARQLALDLAGAPAHGRDDFLVTPATAPALALLDRPEAWPQGRLLLIGPEGSGKTHAAAFWAAEQGAARVGAAALRPEAADALLPEGGALVVEDAHRVAGAAGAERGLFHLWNLAPTRGALLLLTARTAPRDWGLALPDLRSRMDAVAQARFGPPDDALLAAVLVKLFADRQLAVAPDVIAALTARMDRDLGLARRLVAAIDEGALEARRPITRRLALETLARLETPEPGC
ncbi:chromosomal replication initiator DnaA [Paracoccus sp. S-4012]|uniref:chromosomal replication initiator DnaA n=1 Tax=Paracoccus sp. S-4012 TaxID=2665648 RepID=UPI0012AEF207|nr:chromosomal replication initiator DnaA [Paracoccus sp. S-4012]MRX50797.1 chromosomal replication initiator DnaA [Paracoccus sp. S-4012]